MTKQRLHTIRYATFVCFLLLSALLAARNSPAGASSAPAPAPQIHDTPAPPADQGAAQLRTISYTYDAAGRLASADDGERRIVYVYDSTGNLLRQQVLPSQRYIYLPLVLRRTP